MNHKPWIYKPNAKKPMIFIVGQNPGKSNAPEKKAFWGNKTGSYVMKLLEKNKLQNVYLTNVTDNELMNESNVDIGLHKLTLDMVEMRPAWIVAFGKIAQASIPSCTSSVINHHHPSYVMRFGLKDEDLKIQETFAMIGRMQRNMEVLR